MPSQSYWLKTGHREKYPELNDDLETEVTVVGGGIAGILTAHQLLLKGKKVVLLERFRILNGTTGNTTAKLSAQHGLIYAELIERYGKERAKLYYQANMDGINEIKKMGKDLQLNGWVTDETVYTFTTEKKKVASFKKEKEAYDLLGIKGDLLKETPLGIDIEAAISMENQGVFHAIEFLNAVLKNAAQNGLKVYENTRVDEMEEREDSVILKTQGGNKVKSRYAVFATHFPTIEKDNRYSDVWGRITQALAYKTDKKLFEGAHISYDTPSVTLRTMEYFGDHYFLIGGQSHVGGDGYSDEKRYEKIHELAQKLFDVKEPAFKWSTHDLMTLDRMPLIGRLYKNTKKVFTITGLNAWGLANSSAGAMMLTDIICGRDHPYAEMYDPYREVNELEGDNEGRENSSKVDKVTKVALDHLKPDQMTIIEKDEDRIGVYKDINGKIHSLSLKCTHAGCNLNMNDGDNTWDCPCHGSRYDKFGKVIYGPAIKNMENKALS